MICILLAASLLAAPADPNAPADRNLVAADPNAAVANPNAPRLDPDGVSNREALKAAAAAARSAADAAAAAAEALERLDPARVRQPAPAVPLAASASGPPQIPPPANWLFQVGMSFILVTGNAESFSGKIDAKALGHWHDWNTEFRANASYGQNTDVDTKETEVTAQNGEVSARGERIFNALGTYLLGGLGINRVNSIAHRITGEVGGSLIWWEDIRPDYTRSRLRTDFGLRAMREQRYQYFPVPSTVDDPLKIIYGPILRFSWRFGLSKSAYFTEEADVMQNIPDQRDIRVNTTTSVTAQLYDSLAINLAFRLGYIGVPAQGKKNTDTELSAGVTWSW